MTVQFSDNTFLFNLFLNLCFNSILLCLFFRKFKTIMKEIRKSVIFLKKSTHFSAAESALKVYDIEINENST